MDFKWDANLIQYKHLKKDNSLIEQNNNDTQFSQHIHTKQFYPAFTVFGKIDRGPSLVHKQSNLWHYDHFINRSLEDIIRYLALSKYKTWTVIQVQRFFFYIS